MSYLSLARKYRPGIFDEIVGQEHIATTLKNAIAMDRVAHAYLFTGPRGVGKTSTARILAKSLNCEKGPGPAPCGACPSCEEIAGGRGMDVMEIDGASNRGINEIRNLKENVKFAPIRGKFKIFIIDEVHMLTPEAFNALLKTLEEPPLHVKFIFATTRPYKVLPTVISRCQRFDFRRILARDIAGKLKEMRENEKLDMTDEAISLIAKAADGSLRDAEVILDQLLVFAKGKLDAPDVVKALGLLEADILSEIADSISAGDRKKLLDLIDQLMQSGKDPTFVATSIISYFRDVLAANIAKEQDRGFSPDEILYIIYTLSTAMDLIHKTNLGRIPLEIALIKLADRKKPGAIREVLDRLEALEGDTKPGFALNAKPGFVSVNTPAEQASTVSQNEIVAERDILLFQKIKDSWGKVLNLIKTKKMSVATFLAEGMLVNLKDNTLTIGFDKSNSLHKEAIEETANRTFVEEAIKSVSGENVRLCIETVEGKPEEGAFEEDMEASPQKEENKIDPIVETALDMFDGKMIDIRGGKR